jgi:hypothetical protein
MNFNVDDPVKPSNDQREKLVDPPIPQHTCMMVVHETIGHTANCEQFSDIDNANTACVILSVNPHAIQPVVALTRVKSLPVVEGCDVL